MARIVFNGTEDLSFSLSDLANLSDDDKWRILSAGAAVMQEAQRSKAKQLFTKYSKGALANSISVVRKNKDGTLIAQIVPKGKHPNTGTGKRMKKTEKGRRSSGNYSGSNAEIAYYLEFGTPRIPATHWIETAVEEAESDVIAAEAAAWDDHLKNKGF